MSGQPAGGLGLGRILSRVAFLPGLGPLFYWEGETPIDLSFAGNSPAFTGPELSSRLLAQEPTDPCGLGDSSSQQEVPALG